MNRPLVAAFILQIPEKRPENKGIFDVRTDFLSIERPEKKEIILLPPLILSPPEKRIGSVDPERILPFAIPRNYSPRCSIG